MALLGKAAMLLSFDVVPEAIAEHDDWHTHEHVPERRSIPGFLRGSRWVALQGQPRYFVMYEVSELGTLASAAYLERLNRPTPWTAKMMTHYRGMARGFCRITGSFGLGLASAHRFEAALAPQSTNEQRLRGQDATLDAALLVTGYSTGKVTSLFEGELSRERFEQHGATGLAGGIYRMDYSL